jgi:hypothetical protein
MKNDDTTMFDEDDDLLDSDLLNRLKKLKSAYKTASWLDEHQPLLDEIVLAMTLIRKLQKELARAIEEINVNRRASKELRKQQP